MIEILKALYQIAFYDQLSESLLRRIFSFLGVQAREEKYGFCRHQERCHWCRLEKQLRLIEGALSELGQEVPAPGDSRAARRIILEQVLQGGLPEELARELVLEVLRSKGVEYWAEKETFKLAQQGLEVL